MSFLKVEAVRAIKLHNKTYRSAKNAAEAYANSASTQFYWQNRDRIGHMTGQQQGEWNSKNRDKFYRRPLPIFTKYFQGR